MIPTAPPIRVALDAHVVGRRKTGNETYIVNLADALAGLDDVEPIVYLDAGMAWPRAAHIERRDLRWRAPQLRLPFELPYRAKRDGAQLLHVQYVAPPIARLPVVTAIHDVSFEDLSGAFSRATRLRLKLSIRLSASRSAAVVTLSEFSRSRIVHHYGIDPDRVVVTPLAADSRWRRLEPEELASRLSGLPLPEQFVLAVGNLHPRKNIPRLIQALAKARDQGAGDLHLVLAGQPAWRAEEIDVAIDKVGGGEWVHKLGYVDDDVLVALHSAAYVVAYPSLYEGFGLPVLEALACGAIVVASSTTSIPEVAGDAAILVDPMSIEAIADGLSKAATDQQLRPRLQEAGPVRASAFTWRRCAERTVEAYRLALRRSS